MKKFIFPPKNKTSIGSIPYKEPQKLPAGENQKFHWKINLCNIITSRQDYFLFSVKPLLQTTLIDNLSSTTNNPNVVNPPDRLTTTANTSTKANYVNLR